MKAIQYERFGGPEVLQYVDIDDPVPGPGEVLIQTAAIGVNFPDIRERLGIYNRVETRVGGVQLPNVGGLAVTGRVVQVGAGADKTLAGRDVVAMMKIGAYAQLAIAKESLTMPLDDGADLSVLAGIAAQGACAHILLQQSTVLKPGETVLVHGAAGGVGGMAVQIAKALGAGAIIGTASTDQRREFVRSLGADAAVALDRSGWTDEVLTLTNGRGVDVLIESIGGEVFEQNFRALAPFGRYLLLGSTRGPGDPFAPRRLMTSAQTLTGFYLPVFYNRPDAITRALRFISDGLASGSIRSTVDRILPLKDAAQAHRLLEGRKVRGVVVLDPTA